MFEFEKYKKNLFLKSFCALSIFILIILGFILIRVSENKKISYDISENNEIKFDDKVYIETYSNPIRFYSDENNDRKMEYYYILEENNLYVFKSDGDTFFDFWNDDFETRNLKKQDDKIVISGYARDCLDSLSDKLELYFEQNDLNLENLNINSFCIDTSVNISRDKKDIYNFLLQVLILISIPLYITRKNYKKFKKDIKNLDLKKLFEENDNDIIIKKPFIFTREYLIILENGIFFGKRIINLRKGNYHTIGNTFGIYKYTDIKHMVVEENMVANRGEYFILYIVLNNNKSVTYRSKIGEKRDAFDDVVKECLKKNSEIKSDSNDKDYAKAFIIKYFKRFLYIIYLFAIYFIYCVFILILIEFLFN